MGGSGIFRRERRFDRVLDDNASSGIDDVGPQHLVLPALEVVGHHIAGEQAATNLRFLGALVGLNLAQGGEPGGFAVGGLAFFAFDLGQSGGGFAPGDIGGEGGALGFLGASARLALGEFLFLAQLFEASRGGFGLGFGGKAGRFGFGLVGPQLGEGGGGFIGLLLGLERGQAVRLGLRLRPAAFFGRLFFRRGTFGGHAFGFDRTLHFRAVAAVAKETGDEHNQSEEGDNDVLVHKGRGTTEIFG